MSFSFKDSGRGHWNTKNCQAYQVVKEWKRLGILDLISIHTNYRYEAIIVTPAKATRNDAHDGWISALINLTATT